MTVMRPRLTWCFVCCLGTFAPLSATLAQTDSAQLRSTQQLANPPPATTTHARAITITIAPDSASALSRPVAWQAESVACSVLNPNPPERLTLSDVLERVLCKSPVLRQALASVQEQQAAVDLAGNAFRPRFNATAEIDGNRIPNSSINSVDSSVLASFNLSWVLFDFGLRNANLEQARQTLAAAMATQDSSTLVTLTETLRIYVEALSVWGRLDALREAEAAANQSATIAQARYDAQIGSLSEKLQAQTALAQATLDRTRSDGQWQSSRGALAVAMGLAVQTSIGMADVESAFPALDEMPTVELLLTQAKTAHPRIRSLRAEVSALHARLDAVRADGNGSVSLSGTAAASRALGSGNGATDHNLGGSIVVSIPLFNGPEQRARAAQVQAQIYGRQAQLESVERELDTEVWRSAQQVRTETESLVAARQLLTSALLSHQVALGRYKAGVGSLLELLTAQTALANARAQLHEAKLANVQSRIRLTLVSGRLGLGANSAAQKK